MIQMTNDSSEIMEARRQNIIFRIVAAKRPLTLNSISSDNILQ